MLGSNDFNKKDNSPLSQLQEHSTDRPHATPVAQRFTLGGRLVEADFLAFVADRAAWLGVSGWTARDGKDIVVVASGPEAMVGALEMAVMLGPLNALVTRVVVEEELGPVAEGFVVR